MKQRQCWHACDEPGCEEVSGAEVDFRSANATARAEGWWVNGEYAKCPRHRFSFQ